jgi:hypothetical protein
MRRFSLALLAFALAAMAVTYGVALQRTNTDASASTTPYCDPALVKHTYSLSRFTLLSPSCRKVTGIVKADATELDGDLHVRLVPDPGQSGLYPLENGKVIVEIICKTTPQKAAAKQACGSYRSPLKPPAVGAHIAVVGRFVKDNPPDHVELHPVTSINILSGTTLSHLPPLDKHADADE